MRPSGSDNRVLPEAAVERLVFYEYCISLVFLSLRRPSAVVRLRPRQRGWVRGLPYTLVSLLLGWWCLPWGLIYTPRVLWTNLCGGRPVTEAERQRWGEASAW